MVKLFRKHCCHICHGNDFGQKQNLRRHLKNVHDIQLEAGVKGNIRKVKDHLFVSNENDADKTVFVCPSCPNYFSKLEELDCHVPEHFKILSKDSDAAREHNEDEDEAEDVDVTLPIDELMPSKPPLHFESTAITHNETRTYSDATLSAMGAMDLPDDEKQKKLLIAELADLHPMAIFDKNNREHNMLGHSATISSLLASQFGYQAPAFKAITPMKRSYFQMLDAGDQRPAASILSHLIANSHLTCLSATDYTEMDENIATILNIDWTRRPWMRVVCARAMEGLILVNRREGLLVNCAEVYSRYPTLDAHHEQTKIKRYQPLNTTLPHPTTKYPNVELFIVEKDNSHKLELGTKTMNVLITSSIRIDKNQPPAVGPSSANGFSVSKDTIIFIRRSFIKWYGDLRQRGFNDLSIRELYPFDEYAQLRQVRSKFHRTTTYLLSRSCSIFANDLCSRPVTIWTLADHNTGTNKDSDAKIASQLFRVVAASVWEQGENAILSRHCVNDQQKKCKTNGKVWNIMDEILSLFNDSSTTNIIGNEQLNRPLTNLANEISPSLITANAEVTRTVCQIFAI
ncbi:hypothetical protein BDB00DRAFT_794584 [Zychaea mexicana]|uniref:uncharacterized protein n=1 Tax=Zychaea mexicana TaxID=64656 RepID=UPI0022FEE634|nr:uncharacterized protein BDB00DRAFT_794584 [Zychaea mexicana]KAI9499587.1 hypothetical protein BDB00DRAFT_794584 [Zychaea mexicana]